MAIADGDMHLKNVALLNLAEAGAKIFTSVRFAPLNDAVKTRVFPGFSGDRMAQKLNGKDDMLTQGDFLTLARAIGLPQRQRSLILRQTSGRRSRRFAYRPLPPLPVQSRIRYSELPVRALSALANDAGYAKEIQDARLAAEAVKIGKQRTKYAPTGRKPSGPKGKQEKAADRHRAEAAAQTQHAAE